MFKYDDGEERKTCICAIDMDRDSIVGIQQVAYENEGIYIKFIKSMLYYIENPEELEMNKEHWKWESDKIETLNAERLKHNLRKIQIGVKACSKTETEFNYRMNTIWKSYTKYLDSLVLDSGHPAHKTDGLKSWQV